MKKSFAQIFWGAAIILFWLVGAAPFVSAAQLDQAQVSQVIQDVRLLEAHGAPRPVVVNAKVTQGMGVRTGVESRGDVTCTCVELPRVGANRIRSCKQGGRELELTSG